MKRYSNHAFFEETKLVWETATFSVAAILVIWTFFSPYIKRKLRQMNPFGKIAAIKSKEDEALGLIKAEVSKVVAEYFEEMEKEPDKHPQHWLNFERKLRTTVTNLLKSMDFPQKVYGKVADNLINEIRRQVKIIWQDIDVNEYKLDLDTFIRKEIKEIGSSLKKRLNIKPWDEITVETLVKDQMFKYKNKKKEDNSYFYHDYEPNYYDSRPENIPPSPFRTKFRRSKKQSTPSNSGIANNMLPGPPNPKLLGPPNRLIAASIIFLSERE